jgi:serine protease Do
MPYSVARLATSTVQSISQAFVLACLTIALAINVSHAQPARPASAMPGSVATEGFADLVERVAPAVVTIRVSSKTGARPGRPLAPNQGTPRADDTPRPIGSGSGFMISADGYLLTNHHVVNGADDIQVVLSDKRELTGKLIGSDQLSDVALVKIEGSGFTFLPIGNVEKLRVGDWVVAIGSPFGLEQTVTKGIVSAKNRDIERLIPFIQTDAAINSGNSGGPLLNLKGEVVGINSMLLASAMSGGFQGISLSIPIDEAMRVSDSLRAVGRVVRGKMGAVLGEVTKEVAEALGLPRKTGAAVLDVEPDSPAAKAGIRGGDVILQFQGKTIDRSVELRRAVGGTKPGTTVTFQVWSQGKARDVQMSLGELNPPPATTATATTPSKPDAPAAQTGAGLTVLGLGVVDLPAALKESSRLTLGVLVDQVPAGGPAASAGVQRGDVILTMNQMDMTTAARFHESASKLDRSKPVALLVWREGRSTYVTIRPSAAK